MPNNAFCDECGLEVDLDRSICEDNGGVFCSTDCLINYSVEKAEYAFEGDR